MPARAVPQLESGSTSLEGSSSLMQRLWEPSLIRPTLRMGLLQPAYETARRAVSKSEVPWMRDSVFRMEPSRDLQTVTPLEVRQFLVPSVASSPRQEVPAGFPSHEPAMARSGSEMGGVDNTAATVRGTSTPALAVSDLARNTNFSSEKQSSLRPLGVDNTEASGPTNLTREIVPNPAFRGVEMVAASTNSPRVTERGYFPGERAQVPAPSPVAPPLPTAPPPPLDINSVADKVYQALVRRHRFERERRGLF